MAVQESNLAELLELYLQTRSRFDSFLLFDGGHRNNILLDQAIVETILEKFED